jgi:hypothetical protein
MPRITASSAAFFLLALASPSWAADLNATLKGVVADTDGLPVPSAEVLLESDALLGARNTLTDDDGRYRFTALPPGDYVVTVTHPGFASWTSEEIRIDLGASVQLDIPLRSKESGEIIEVYGTAPAIDVERTQTGVVLDARYLKDLPNAGRDYQSAVTVAPGVVGGGNPNMHGSFDTGNQYYINGVNTTDPLTNTFSMNMNYDAIEAIEVITGGMDAEYGRSLGGAVNILTKSGSNEFEAYAFLLHSDENMIVAKELDGDDFGDYASQQLVFNLGGPIIKDKVWFFGSFQGDRYITTASYDPESVGRDPDLYPLEPRNWRSIYAFGKVTAQPTPEHRVWLHMQADPTWIKNVFQDPYTMPSGEAIQNQGGWLGSLGHTFTPGSNLLLETQLYYQKSVLNFFPATWEGCDNVGDYGECLNDFEEDLNGDGLGDSWYAWDADDFSYGTHPYASFNVRNRMSATTALTAYFDLLGEHEMKVGLQGELLRSFYVYPGLEQGYEYWTDTGDPLDFSTYEPVLQVRYDNNLDRTLKGFIFSAYVQDVYKPIPRLTFRPGVRLDKPILRDDLGDVIYSNMTLAPRFGAAYALTKDNKSSVHAFYGRFYDTGYLVLSDLLQKQSQGLSGYNWDAEAGDWEDEPAWSVAGQFLQHTDLRNPFSDELNLGYSRVIGEDLAFDATFIYEEARRFWEDDEVNLIWDREGSNVIGYRNGVNEAVYRLRTSDELFSRYASMEFSVQKRFSDNWTVLGSYTYSKSVGTNSADQATAAMDIAEQRQYEAGLLAYDVPHNLKLSGTYTNPEAYGIGKLDGGYVLGWNFNLRSGYPYRQLVWNDYYGSYSNYNDVNDGSYRLPAVSQLDLRSGLTWDIGRASWMVGLDIFNVFNDRAVTSVNQVFDDEAVGDEQTFGDPLDRQSPRYFQFVARAEF